MENDAPPTPSPTVQSRHLVCLVRLPNGNVHQVALNGDQRALVFAQIVAAQNNSLTLFETPLEGLTIAEEGRAEAKTKKVEKSRIIRPR